jgi:hypothetical protein
MATPEDNREQPWAQLGLSVPVPLNAEEIAYLVDALPPTPQDAPQAHPSRSVAMKLHVAELELRSREDVEPCRHCGRDIFEDARGVWQHKAADGGLNRGCRAASYTADKGWDDSLRRDWKAEPRK